MIFKKGGEMTRKYKRMTENEIVEIGQMWYSSTPECPVKASDIADAYGIAPHQVKYYVKKFEKSSHYKPDMVHYSISGSGKAKRSNKLSSLKEKESDDNLITVSEREFLSFFGLKDLPLKKFYDEEEKIYVSWDDLTKNHPEQKSLLGTFKALADFTKSDNKLLVIDTTDFNLLIYTMCIKYCVENQIKSAIKSPFGQIALIGTDNGLEKRSLKTFSGSCNSKGVFFYDVVSREELNALTSGYILKLSHDDASIINRDRTVENRSSTAWIVFKNFDNIWNVYPKVIKVISDSKLNTLAASVCEFTIEDGEVHTTRTLALSVM